MCLFLEEMSGTDWTGHCSRLWNLPFHSPFIKHQPIPFCTNSHKNIRLYRIYNGRVCVHACAVITKTDPLVELKKTEHGLHSLNSWIICHALSISPAVHPACNEMFTNSKLYYFLGNYFSDLFSFSLSYLYVIFTEELLILFKMSGWLLGYFLFWFFIFQYRLCII